MEESSGVERESGEEISLLAEELIQLSIKKSLVEPNVKPTLICSVWMKKSFNTESFKAQLKSILKTKKKFEIQVVGQNLFSIVFDLEEDLKSIMEGRPWLFRKYLILFDRLRDLVERDQIRLTSSPYWNKIGTCPPEFDKKDLMHAIGSTFESIIRSEIKDDICRFMVNLDVQKPLRRGIFVASENSVKSWIPFKFKKLPLVCFGYGRMDHGLNDCSLKSPAEKDKIRDDPPYTIALKAKSKVVGKESIKFNAFIKKVGPQHVYIGKSKEQNGQEEEVESIVLPGILLGGKKLTSWDEGLKEQEGDSVETKIDMLQEVNNKGDKCLKDTKMSKRRRLVVTNQTNHSTHGGARIKRKCPEERNEEGKPVEVREDGVKMSKNNILLEKTDESIKIMCVDGEQSSALNNSRSAASFGLADRTQ
ncbi:Zinc finger, CCHC-type-like protein [Gossypium australe]|uniref:Zinc finger, CCHC-type-like protein n=1 Tax=Gossypium australe TaxID=47621 RepID=A0A5B6VHQ8_9ROSI|nr:Zinc finger, CCHC-type-like protein [Gossypium australe]